MSDLLKDYSYLDFFLLNLLSILLGFALRSSLAIVKQKWVTTYHQTLILFTATYNIHNYNIDIKQHSLSLGMIGALSIVRFRTPVKSPLELVMFFSLITIGIGIAVNYKLSLMLTIIIILLIFTFSFLQKVYAKKTNNFINNSYDEGTANHTMEIKSKNKINTLDKNSNVESFYFNKEENSYNYRLIFKNKIDLDLLKKDLEANNDIDIIDIKYVL